MKLAAAILAGAVSALKTRDGDCDWEWEECSWMYWRFPCDDSEADTDCGYIYWDDWTLEEFWVTCDEFADWYWCEGGEEDQDDCDDTWYEDSCWGEWWMEACGDGETECGWWYWDETNEDTYWVDCDTWELVCGDDAY